MAHVHIFGGGGGVVRGKGTDTYCMLSNQVHKIVQL